jgi:hypothetical protein
MQFFASEFRDVRIACGCPSLLEYQQEEYSRGPETPPVAVAATEVRSPMAGDTAGGMTTDEKPGRDTLELVSSLFLSVLTIPVGIEVTADKAEIKLLKALVSTRAPVEICEMREEISEPRGPVAWP